MRLLHHRLKSRCPTQDDTLSARTALSEAIRNHDRQRCDRPGRRGRKRGRIPAMTASGILLVMTNLPDADSAHRLAARLIEQRLAACVNILPPCRSVYRWQGKVEDATEVPLHIKTTSARYAVLENAIRTHHPYDLPEIIAIPIEHSLPEYAAWVTAETEANEPNSPGDSPC